MTHDLRVVGCALREQKREDRSDKHLIISKKASGQVFIYLFLGPHLRHMEVPRLGVMSEP